MLNNKRKCVIHEIRFDIKPDIRFLRILGSFLQETTEQSERVSICDFGCENDEFARKVKLPREACLSYFIR